MPITRIELCGPASALRGDAVADRCAGAIVTLRCDRYVDWKSSAFMPLILVPAARRLSPVPSFAAVPSAMV